MKVMQTMKAAELRQKNFKTRDFVLAFHLLQKRERGIPLGALRSVSSPSAIPVLKCRRFLNKKKSTKQRIG
jgi:hypothetical protein